MRKSIKIFLFLPLSLMILTAAVIAPETITANNPVPALAQEPTPIPIGPGGIQPGTLPCDPSQVHALYFYSEDCPHCMAILNDLLLPMQNELGTKLHIRLVEIDYAENYELLIRAGDHFSVKPEEKRVIPTLIIDGQTLIGEDAIRENLRDIVEQGILNGGIPWPDIPDFDPAAIISEENAAANTEMCTIDSGDTCETGAPIYAAYFFETGCDSCSRVESDLAYLRSKYPQLIVEKFNVYDSPALGLWLADRAGRDDFHSPSVFIGSETWIGEEEITPDAIETALQCFAQEGSPKVWEAFNEEQGNLNIIDQFRSMSWLTVVLAGLVDGLNPCAFATLIFFISYLTISGRKDREVIIVGISFTLGVFIAYLIVGLGFYKVLDLLGNILNVVARWVYGLTALLCIALAVFSFMDFAKARKGKLEDMSLNLPEGLRKRINAVIRKGRSTNSFMVSTFATGLVISILELACTGQVYLPTIIFVSSMPELRLRAIFYLIIYNLLFILPLIVVFILAYYGTSSKELTHFLQKHAAVVKIGLGILFFALGIWLILSAVA